MTKTFPKVRRVASKVSSTTRIPEIHSPVSNGLIKGIRSFNILQAERIVYPMDRITSPTKIKSYHETFSRIFPAPFLMG